MSIQNDHPFQCSACGNEYRASRYAARCCKVSSIDLRDGTRLAFDPDLEAQWVKEDEARWEAIYAECHYECSCGESYKTIDAAIQCRKCRSYTDEGYCTQVFDRDQDYKVVWTIDASHEEPS